MQRRKVFFRARRVLEYLFFLDTYTDLFYCRDFIFLQTLRLCALCENFLSKRLVCEKKSENIAKNPSLLILF